MAQIKRRQPYLNTIVRILPSRMMVKGVYRPSLHFAHELEGALEGLELVSSVQFALETARHTIFGRIDDLP